MRKPTLWQRIKNYLNPRSEGIIPGTDTYQVLHDWIHAPYASSSTLDWQLSARLNTMRQDARALALNNPIARQYLALLSDNTIGPQGMRLQAQIRNNNGALSTRINDSIEAGWAEFWKSPFADGRMSGVTGEQTLLKTVATDGEAFVRMVTAPGLNRFGFALQIIPADRVDHTVNQAAGEGRNEIRLGVEVNEWNRPVAYHCLTRAAMDLNTGTARDRVRVPASEMIHLYDLERSDQTRGITWFNSVGMSLKVLDGYVEASVTAARTAACAFPVFEMAPEFMPELGKNPSMNIDLEPGKGLTLPPGLRLAPWDPKQPTQSFGEFVKASLRFFASGMHVSYNALANDLEGVNYSSIRSGLLIERDHWQVLQQWWISDFLTRVYSSWLSTALLSGALTLDSRLPYKYQAVKFQPRGWKWVDPLKDVNAAVIAIENGLGSRDKYLAEQGMEFEGICEQLADEKRIAKESGLVFGEKLGPVTGDQENQPAVPDPRSRTHLRAVIMNMLQED